MEAKQVAEDVGAVIGLAILLTRLALHRGDSPTEAEGTSFRQPEPDFSQAETLSHPEAEPEEIENPFWLEAEEPQLVL